MFWQTDTCPTIETIKFIKSDLIAAYNDAVRSADVLLYITRYVFMEIQTLHVYRKITDVLSS